MCFPQVALTTFMSFNIFDGSFVSICFRIDSLHHFYGIIPGIVKKLINLWGKKESAPTFQVMYVHMYMKERSLANDIPNVSGSYS